MKPCKVCGKQTENVFNINLKAVSICEPCANSIFIQQALWFTTNLKVNKPINTQTTK